jgi:hypothetical protein
MATHSPVKKIAKKGGSSKVVPHAQKANSPHWPWFYKVRITFHRILIFHHKGQFDAPTSWDQKSDLHAPKETLEPEFVYLKSPFPFII